MRYLERVGEALDRIAARLSKGDPLIGAVAEIETNFRALESDFLEFFPELAAFCADWRRQRQARGAGRKPEALSQSRVTPPPPA